MAALFVELVFVEPAFVNVVLVELVFDVEDFWAGRGGGAGTDRFVTQRGVGLAGVGTRVTFSIVVPLGTPRETLALTLEDGAELE